MGERLVLHIGTMKSGTTYLQNVLAALEPQLSAAGWCYPRTWDELDIPNQQQAFYELLADAVPWVTSELAGSHSGAGAALRSALAEHPGPAVVSSEALASLDDDGIAACMGLLTSRRVEVVITARDLGRVLPSWWQQSLRNGSPTADYDTVLGWVENAWGGQEAAAAEAGFWRGFGVGGLAARWGAHVGLDNVTVVTVPRGGNSALLWERFRAAAQLPDAVPSVPPEVPHDRANGGMTAAEAVVLRPLVQSLADAGHSTVARSRMVSELMADVLLPRPERGPALGVPSAWLDRVCAWSEGEVARLEALGVRLVGDRSDLLVDRTKAVGEEPAVAEVAEVGAAIAAATLPLVGALRRGVAAASVQRQPSVRSRVLRRVHHLSAPQLLSLAVLPPVAAAAAVGHFVDGLPW